MNHYDEREHWRERAADQADEETEQQREERLEREDLEALERDYWRSAAPRGRR